MKLKYILIAIAVFGIAKTKALPIIVKQESDTITLPNIKVKGNQKDKIEMSSTLKQKAVEQRHGLSLGDLLSNISGIQDIYYGPASGAPMIRSLTGNRVKILTNGVSITDLSAISPEHTIFYDDMDIEEVDVNKNSSSVLYGGKAIGGAVNMKTDIIPKKATKDFNLKLMLEGGSNSGTRQGLKLYGNINKNFSWTIGGSSSFIERIRIPGKSKSSILYDPKIVDNNTALQGLGQVWVSKKSVRNISLFPYIDPVIANALKDPNNNDYVEGEQYTYRPQRYNPDTYDYEPNLPNPVYVEGQDPVKDLYKEQIKGIYDYVNIPDNLIPNSHSDKANFNAGLNYISKSFSIGGSYQHNYSFYGVPIYARIEPKTHNHSHGGHTHKPEKVHPYEPVSVKSYNDNVSLQAKVNKEILFIKNIKLNGLAETSINKELIGKYAENRYNINNYAARLELAQKSLDFLSGTTGVEYSNRTIDGLYNIRYLPDNKSSDLAFFTIQNLQYKFTNLQLGYRYGIVKREATLDDSYIKGRGLAGGNLNERTFHLNQFSSKLLFNIANKAYLLGAYAHSERAPEVNELYAGNNHFSIGIEENGDDNLDKEFVNSIELGAGISFSGLKLDISFYKNFYKNYIYLGHTGVTRSRSLVVKEWRQADTNIYGMELNMAYNYDFNKYGIWGINGFYDLVKNKNVSESSQRKFTDGDYMPNMPSSRYGLGLNGKVNNFELNISMEHYLKQKYLGKMIFDEIAMPAFTMLNANISLSSKIANLKTEYYIFGRNLLNQEARPQNSIMKYLAPLPGINIGMGVKFKL